MTLACPSDTTNRILAPVEGHLVDVDGRLQTGQWDDVRRGPRSLATIDGRWGDLSRPSPIDADGVNMVAIKELARRLRAVERRLQAIEALAAESPSQRSPASDSP